MNNENLSRCGLHEKAYYRLLELFKENRLPFISALVFGFAAHAFMLTNKIPFDDDLPFIFDKGASYVSGRYGLDLLRLVMPDQSMPWIYGIISLVLLSVAACFAVRLFEIKSPVLQLLLPAAFITFPSETGTMSYMFTSAPYALALLLTVAAVYRFESGAKLRWPVSALMIAFACSIYQGYFSFAASFCVLLMIKALVNNEKTAAETFKYGIKLLSLLLLALAVYGLAIVFFSSVLNLPLLSEVINEKQSIVMRIAVAYSAYLNTVVKGYFGFVNSGVSRLAHIALLICAALAFVVKMKGCRDLKKLGLLCLCLFLFPLSCYCLYMLADNSYIHALALYSFSSLYLLVFVLLEGGEHKLLTAGTSLAAVALAVIVVNNVYFANSFYLYTHLQYENVYSTYNSVLTQVYQTPGFDENSSIAIVGEHPVLQWNYDEAFDFSSFSLPGNNITKPIQAENVFKYYLGSELPFADEQTVAEIRESGEYALMPIYPYEGSVKKIGDTIVVKLAE